MVIPVELPSLHFFLMSYTEEHTRTKLGYPILQNDIAIRTTNFWQNYIAVSIGRETWHTIKSKEICTFVCSDFGEM